MSTALLCPLHKYYNVKVSLFPQCYDEVVCELAPPLTNCSLAKNLCPYIIDVSFDVSLCAYVLKKKKKRDRGLARKSSSSA